MQGINYFNCLDGHGVFLPSSILKRNSQFAEVGANTSETPTVSSDQDSESSQPGRSVSAPEDRLRNLFLELQKLGMQDDAGNNAQHKTMMTRQIILFHCVISLIMWGIL